MRPIPDPPALQQARDAKSGDVFRLTWWTFLGFLHGARRGSGAHRVASGVCAAMYWPLAPVMLVGHLKDIRDPSVTYYLTDTAALAIKTTATGWVVHSHASTRPGTSQGRALRLDLLPELLAFADAHQIPVTVNAATDQLAACYQREVPGLVDIGSGCPRGRRLYRNPVRASAMR